MTLSQFRKWLREEIDCFDDETENAVNRCDETVPTIREAERYAIGLGLPAVAAHCHRVTTTLLALPVARLLLCECLAMIDNGQSRRVLVPGSRKEEEIDLVALRHRSLQGRPC